MFMENTSTRGSFRANMHWTHWNGCILYHKGNSQLYGDHTGSTFALFTQFDQRFLTVCRQPLV